MPTPLAAATAIAGALDRLKRDLEAIFGARLRALVAHGPRVRAAGLGESASLPLNALALVDRVTYKDLVECAHRAADWIASGVTVPLLLSPEEFERSLDTFPVEYGEIIAHHVLVAGTDPFARLAVRDEDLRRACEAWGKSHLIQLREGYVEAGGDPAAVARLVQQSASPFAALLAMIARLRGLDDTGLADLARATEGIAGLPQAPVREVLALEARSRLDGDTAMSLFPAYLDVVERLARFLDGWTRTR